MGIFDMFGGGARHASGPNQPVPAAQPTPGNIPQGAGAPQSGTTGTAANGVVPTNATGSESKQDNAAESPFKQFEDLWQPTLGADGKPVQVTKDPLYNVDPKQVMEAAQRTDFKSVATPEQLAKVAAGGQEGVQAMMDIMQSVASSVYANAAVAATKIAESGITKALSQAESRLPDAIRRQTLSESLASKNPALNNPAVKPLVDSTRAQFAQKYPNATAAELESMTMNYFKEVGNAFNPQAKPDPNVDPVTGKQQEDWGEFFNLATKDHPMF